MRMSRTWILWLASLLVLAGCASGGPKMTELDKVQYAYSAAILWEDFEGGWQLVDPEYRKAHPMTDLQFARYQQIEISRYHELGATIAADGMTAAREIGIGVVNRHDMTERNARYTEQWRYDPEAKTWWLTVGLPDLWAGE